VLCGTLGGAVASELVFVGALDRSETRRDGGYKHNWSFSLSGDYLKTAFSSTLAFSVVFTELCVHSRKLIHLIKCISFGERFPSGKTPSQCGREAKTRENYAFLFENALVWT
uniref:Uncharacterized protein n=1 Tax=Haplochromis burtoni TaxID=8153 RepID=A0A3Q2WJ22_HAPBU